MPEFSVTVVGSDEEVVIKDPDAGRFVAIVGTTEVDVSVQDDDPSLAVARAVKLFESLDLADDEPLTFKTKRTSNPSEIRYNLYRDAEVRIGYKDAWGDYSERNILVLSVSGDSISTKDLDKNEFRTFNINRIEWLEYS